MKKYFLLIAVLIIGGQFAVAQLTTTPNGGNKKAIVQEQIGLTTVTIDYSRPGVKGREGKIWGALVPFGFTDLGFGSSKAAPWRAGANENTTITFSGNVKLNGKDLAAGKYGFFIAVGKEESILIFSKNNSSWGSFFYNENEDALRLTVKQKVNDRSAELLSFEFLNQTANAATVALIWEKWQFAFTVEAEILKTQVGIFRDELRSPKGFTASAYIQAANWCATNNTNLEEAAQWAEFAINGKYIGEKNFNTLSTKARIVNMLGKKAEGDLLIKEALTIGDVNQVDAYASQLLATKNGKEAAAIFKSNFKKFPNQFVTSSGMAKALSSEGDFKQALKYANAAFTQAQDAESKLYASQIVEKLKAGKDIN